MPSQLHESHLLLFRNQPALAAELIRDAPCAEVPVFREARKRFVWPVYVVNLRARLECPVALLVITPDEAVARWAAKTVGLGGLNHFVPYVLGPSGVPEVTDEVRARENPELAVLSAMAHGRDADPVRALEIAIAAQKASVGLDADRSRIYVDLIMNSLGEAAREALNTMATQKYEFQSDFARKYIALGEAQGEARGRAALILRLLMTRFGRIDSAVGEQIQRASVDELDVIGERLLTARTLQDALGA